MNGKDAESWTVSIHATLAGGDAPRPAMYLAWITFLSTPPSRVATVQVVAPVVTKAVSIHATPAGGDIVGYRNMDELVEFLSTPPPRVATLRAQLQQ